MEIGSMVANTHSPSLQSTRFFGRLRNGLYRIRMRRSSDASMIALTDLELNCLISKGYLKTWLQDLAMDLVG